MQNQSNPAIDDIGNQNTESRIHRKRRVTLAFVLGMPFVGSLAWLAFHDGKVPTAEPLQIQQLIVGEIAQESIKECVENLPQLADVGVASFVAAPNTIVLTDSYPFLRRFIPSLSRVRRLMEFADNEESKELVADLLKPKFIRSCKQFEDAKRTHDATWLEAAKAKRSYSEDNDSLSDYSRFCVWAPVSAYILAELNISDSLPIMADAYDSGRKLPMDRIFLFYAMHRLMIQHPDEGLSPEELAILREYQQLSTDVPNPDVTFVTSWNATLADTDFRHTLVHQEIGLKQQPHTRMYIWPSALAKHNPRGAIPNIEFDPLYVRIREFVRIVYEGS